jgi:hypothetical protein
VRVPPGLGKVSAGLVERVELELCCLARGFVVVYMMNFLSLRLLFVLVGWHELRSSHRNDLQVSLAQPRCWLRKHLWFAGFLSSP